MPPATFPQGSAAPGDLEPALLATANALAQQLSAKRQYTHGGPAPRVGDAGAHGIHGMD